MNDLYTFVYRGVLTDESLNKAGRKSRASFDPADAERIKTALSFDLLDAERIAAAERMALIYTAIHAFENAVRHFVSTAMSEEFQEEWWANVPTKVQNKAKGRIEDEAKFRWHGARGGAEIEYCDFGDLSSIIVVNWSVFEAVLVDLEWVKSTLSVLERSRNIAMHGGVLARQDIERIGINIRDWLRQAG
ncbi:MAG: Swt1 family HEPN domain-containing protein [Planctomycetota bacterium]